MFRPRLDTTASRATRSAASDHLVLNGGDGCPLVSGYGVSADDLFNVNGLPQHDVSSQAGGARAEHVGWNPKLKLLTSFRKNSL